jgi:Ca2+-binding EF-hand superfamily protein
MESLFSLQQTDLTKTFSKYDSQQKGYLTKTEFKCAFIFATGLKPSKQDMQLVKEFLQATDGSFQIRK